MAQASDHNPELPTSLKEPLEQVCDHLADELGDTLSSVILYGEIVKTGEFDSRSSIVNVMVVLVDVNVEALDKLASCIRRAAPDCRLAPMVLNKTDLRSSTDVFPIKFLDMQEHHVVLWGEDVLNGLPIARDHIRLRCEQEIKNLMLRLRQSYVQRSHLPEAVEDTLSGSVTSLLSSLSVLIDLKTGSMPAAEPDIIAGIEALGLEGRVLANLLALKRGQLKPDTAELKELYDEFMRLVQKAAEIVDTL